MSETKFVRLSNDRILAFAEYGDENGVPVIFCHGWPSSCTMAQLTHNAANDLGIRIISPDRPGISGSTFDADRNLLDWPALVRRLADNLGLSEFRMLAISGGAPYAYATARAMPERVRAIAVVSGAVPIVDLADRRGLLRLYRWMLALHRASPEVLRKLFLLARPILSARPPVWFRPVVLKALLLQRCDAESLRDSAAFEAVFESQRRAWRKSAEGIMVDAQIYARPWGFRLEDVRVPVRLWHGEQDRAFAVHLAEQIASRLPNCNAHYVEGAGHYSLPIRYTRQILQDLISAGGSTPGG